MLRTEKNQWQVEMLDFKSGIEAVTRFFAWPPFFSELK